MKITTMACFAGGLLALVLTAPPQARADQWDQKIVFTFSAPVEIPGQILPAGTYVFKLLDSASDRNIVQVFNDRENHLFGTFLTIPDYRLKPTDKPIVTFTERAAGCPEAIRTWFYPSENYGHDFVYPKAKAVELAKANNEPVASMPNELAENTTQPTASVDEPQVVALREAPLTAQQPTEEEVGLSEVFFLMPEADRQTAELPKTAGVVPLIGLLGLLSLGVAGSLRFALAKIK